MRRESKHRVMVAVWLPAIAVVVFSALSSGCQNRVAGTPDLAPVTGTVTLDGKPTDRAIVSFEGPGNKSSFGNTDSTGRYELNYTRLDAPPGPGYVDPIPAKYNTRTTLKADVKAGTNVINFELTTKKE